MIRNKNIGSFIDKNWLSSWYTYKKEYSSALHQDFMVSIYVRSLLLSIEFQNFIGYRFFRLSDLFIVDLYILFLRLLDKHIYIDFVEKVSYFFNRNVFLTINRLFSLDLFTNGFFIALKIAKFIEKRVRLRSNAIKLLLKSVKKNCMGIYVLCKGRLSSTDMASNDKLYIGSNPLQRINCHISYGQVVTNTDKGLQCIKVWINNYVVP